MADARSNLKSLLDQVKTTHQRFVITRHGEADAVLMSVADLEALEESLEIVSDPDTMAAIREGLEASARGETVTLDEVRRDLGL